MRKQWRPLAFAWQLMILRAGADVHVRPHGDARPAAPVPRVLLVKSRWGNRGEKRGRGKERKQNKAQMKNTSSLKREEVQCGIHCLPERQSEGLSLCRAHSALQRHGWGCQEKTTLFPSIYFKMSCLLSQIAEDGGRLPSSPIASVVRVY